MIDGTDTITEDTRGCPRCGGTDLAEILYGYPEFDDALDRDLRGGRIALGGCVRPSLAPTHICNACDLDLIPAAPPSDPYQLG